MSNKYFIKDYEPCNDDRFFFDANIWIGLFVSLGGWHSEIRGQYDGFLKKVIEKKATIYISSLILSEFINRYLKLEYNLYVAYSGNENMRLKEYREEEDYKRVLKSINEDIEHRILEISKRLHDHFSEIPISGIINDFQNRIDFNDAYYHQLATIKGLKLVTHDGDFRKIFCKVDLITANRKLL